MKIGIPRSMFFYQYSALFENFFDFLGVDTILSPTTNDLLYNEGKVNINDEFCLPLKVMAGHISYLRRLGISKIFIPVIVGNKERNSFFCFNQIHLYEIIRGLGIAGEDNILTGTFYYEEDNLLEEGFIEIGGKLGFNSKEVRRVLKIIRTEEEINRENSIHRINKKVSGTHFTTEAKGEKNNNKVSKKPFIVTEERETGEGGTKDRCCNDKKLVLNIGLVGRSYVVEDRWINNNIKSSLKNLGCNIVTEKTYRCYHENTSGPTQGLQNNINHFTLTGNSIITIQKMNNDSRIDGIIYLIPFNCGPDAGVELTVKSNGLNKPFLKLVIDEGKGMAGTQTRLEAFIDILNYELVSHL